MKIGLNQFSWPAFMPLEKVFSETKRAGYDAIELCYTHGSNKNNGEGSVVDALDLTTYINPLLNADTSIKEIDALKKLSADFELPISSLGGIATFTQMPFNSTNKQVAEASMSTMKTIVDHARALNVGIVQLIPGFVGSETNYEDNFYLLVERIQHLADYAGSSVMIGIENVWNNFLYSPLEFKQFIDEINRANVGAYLDIGNVRRLGYPEQWISTLGNRIKCLHIKDYSLGNDNINSFTNLLGGDVDFDAVAETLRSIGYEGMAHVEIIPPAKTRVFETLAFAHRVAESIFNNKE